MSYKILLHAKANELLESLDKEISDGIRSKLKSLEKYPEKGNSLKYSDYRRLRIGDYRAIYEIDRKDIRITVLFIGHRNNVYDDFSRLV